ncbi:MAG: sugar ABC transporter permease, partial [Oscillospiraceae bacterium]|nr:sugar ABC transporter permease [Oscillospiraceae bacterium]
MRYIDYKQLNPFQRAWYKITRFILAIPGYFVTFGKFVAKNAVGLVFGIGRAVRNYVMRFIKGDWTTKVSYLIMGFGNVMNGQIVKGLL